MSHPPTPRFTIARAWEDYRLIVIPINAGRTQIKELRRAFYAGCESLMAQIMGGLSPGPDSQQSDEDYLQALQAELLQFAKDCQRGVA